MHHFRGNIWDFDNKAKVMDTLGYPLPMNDIILEITEARNIELRLGLQVNSVSLCHFVLFLLFPSNFCLTIYKTSKYACVMVGLRYFR
jgi:hypothetical protein